MASRVLRIALWLWCAGPVFSQSVTFSPPLSSPTQAGAVASASGDFNGDGIADLAISNAGVSNIAILLGNGDGTFKAAANAPVANGCVVGLLLVSDFHSDHKPDLLAVCEGGAQMFVYPGRGDGTFGAAITTQLPSLAFAGTLIFFPLGLGSAVGDFNGDGKQDLVLLLANDFTNLSPKANLFWGNGDGTFRPGGIIDGTAGVVAMVAADFNGDHKLDLAFLTLTQNTDFDGNMTSTQTLAIQLGRGDGTFQAGPAYPWTGASFSLAAGDVNGDGFVDLVSGGISFTATQADTPPSVISVLLGDGKGNFKPGFTASEPLDDLVVGFCLGNLRGKGTADLLEQLWLYDEATQTVSIGIGTRDADGTGGYGSLSAVTAVRGTFSMSAACADFNGDGLMDTAYTGISDQGVETLFGPQIDLTALQQLTSIIQMLPAGNLYVTLNSTPRDLTFSNVNAASFASGPLAANSIVTAFWNGPAKPSGIGVNVTDSARTTRAAKVFYASASQINYALPDGTATGNATITITGATNTYTSQAQIVSVAPGVFNTGGLAVGNTLTVHNGKQTSGNLVQADSSGKIQPAPINVGTGSDQVYLILYGTGLRNHTAPVTATAGKTALTVAYAGAQGAFLDEDQMNILLPQSLRGAGLVDVVLNVDGQATNPVQILIQ